MVVDEVGAEEAKEFAGAVVAAVGGAIERQNALAGEVLAVVLRGDEHGEFQRAADAPEGEGAAQEMVRRAVGAGGDPLRGVADELGGGMVPGVEEIGGAQVREERRRLGRAQHIVEILRFHGVVQTMKCETQVRKPERRQLFRGDSMSQPGRRRAEWGIWTHPASHSNVGIFPSTWLHRGRPIGRDRDIAP